MKIICLYCGKLQAFGPRGKPSGINKSPVQQVEISRLGFAGDHQADKRFHGGPEKAIHQYALTSYEKLCKHRPLQHTLFVPGSIGENLCAEDMSDSNVHIGDVYQLGSATIQVSSPRIPCWKIDHKYNIADLHKYIASQAITGWYYRVLQEGEVTTEQPMRLLERKPKSLSVERLMQIHEGINCTAQDTQAAMQLSGLDPEWTQRLERKLTLRKSSEAKDHQL